MKVKTLKKLLAKADDNAEVNASFNLVQFSYTGRPVEIHKLVIKRVTGSKKTVTLHGVRKDR